MGLKVYHDLGLTYYHVGYLNDITVSGKPQKNVVGYDAESGYTFSDSKKKPLEGSIDKNNLALTNNDVCASFAVSVSISFEIFFNYLLYLSELIVSNFVILHSLEVQYSAPTTS